MIAAPGVLGAVAPAVAAAAGGALALPGLEGGAAIAIAVDAAETLAAGDGRRPVDADPGAGAGNRRLRIAGETRGLPLLGRRAVVEVIVGPAGAITAGHRNRPIATRARA